MTGKCAAFATGSIAPFRLGARLPQVQHGRPTVRYAQISMQTGKKVKKVAPVVFAKDLKGNPVWRLRGARLEDVPIATGLIKTLPDNLVKSFVEDSQGCSLVVEGTVQGTHEGEGYLPRVFGIVLADITARVKDPKVGMTSGFVKDGELIVARVDSVMPDAASVQSQLILGAMKKMKAAECQTVTVMADKDNKSYIESLKEIGFKEASSDSDTSELVANLIALSPDPKRKIE